MWLLPPLCTLLPPLTLLLPPLVLLLLLLLLLLAASGKYEGTVGFDWCDCPPPEALLCSPLRCCWWFGLPYPPEPFTSPFGVFPPAPMPFDPGGERTETGESIDRDPMAFVMPETG